MGSYRAQLMIPGEDTCPRERKEFMRGWKAMLEEEEEDSDDVMVEELKEAEDWQNNQALLTNLKDWYSRQVTCSTNVVRRVYSTLLEWKGDLDPADDEETKAMIEDLDLEEAGDCARAGHPQNPLNRITLYPFTLSDQQIELLLQTAGIESSPSSTPVMNSESTLKDALELMIQRMGERYEVPFPYWIFRTIPSLFLQEPLLMEWASAIFPPPYLSKVVHIASPAEVNHVSA